MQPPNFHNIGLVLIGKIGVCGETLYTVQQCSSSANVFSGFIYIHIEPAGYMHILYIYAIPLNMVTDIFSEFFLPFFYLSITQAHAQLIEYIYLLWNRTSTLVDGMIQLYDSVTFCI